MTQTNITLKNMKNDYDYLFTDSDLKLLCGKTLTVKKSEDYFILTYYASDVRDGSEKLAKYEIHWTNENIYHYPIALKKAEIMAMLEDSAPVLDVLNAIQAGIKSGEDHFSELGIRKLI